jgi:hypothetical protein
LKGSALIQNLLPLLPRRIGAIGLTVAFGCVAVGCGLWLVGARFSRPLLALAASVGGGAIGFHSSRWFGQTLDPWMLSLLGALLLGVAGFMAHRWLAAVGLGIILAAWAVLTTIACQGPTGLTGGSIWPAILPPDWTLDFVSIFPRVIPHQVIGLLSAVAVLVTLIGLTIAFFWQRFGVVLFWSLLGLLCSVLALLTAAREAGPDYVRMIPRQSANQAIALGALLSAGAVFQWKITFSKPRPKSSTGGGANAPASAHK